MCSGVPLFKKLAIAVASLGLISTAMAATPDLPSCDSWRPACSGNYTNSSRPASYPIKYIVIHKVQGSASSAASWFQNCAANVSAHFTYNNSTGYCYQSVREADIAWHAGNWTYNTQSVGIEHGGFVSNNDTSNACYQESAKETKSCIKYYDVQHNRTRIIGHNQVPGATHTDPGPHWNWTYYMNQCDPSSEPHYTAPAAVSRTQDRICLVAKGENGSIYTRPWHEVNGWQSWHRRGTQTFKYGPAAVSKGSQHVELFATGNDREIWRNAWYEGNGWGGWTKIPGGPDFYSQPTVCSRDSTHMQVFALAEGDKIWHCKWTMGSGWGNWVKLDDREWRDAPAAISKGPDHMELFARAKDGKIWRKAWYQGNGWGVWHKTADRTFNERPAVVSRDSSHMEIFSLEAGNAVWHNKWVQGNGWSGWSKLDDSNHFSPVGAVSRQPDHIEIFARKSGGVIAGKIWRQGNGWGNWHDHGPRP